MARDTPERKVGDGHAAAMGRLGLRELRSCCYPGSNIAQSPEYGLYGQYTPGEIAESRRSDAPELEEERGSVLEDRLRQAEASRDGREAEKDPKDPEKE